MSAHLTVYAMAMEAERPLRNSEIDKARQLAEVDAAQGQRIELFLSRLSGALRRPWRYQVSAGRLMIASESGLAAVGQQAG